MKIDSETGYELDSGTGWVWHPAPCTLHPAPCTLHPAPCTLHHIYKWACLVELGGVGDAKLLEHRRVHVPHHSRHLRCNE